jgi:hypothetical protein
MKRQNQGEKTKPKVKFNLPKNQPAEQFQKVMDLKHLLDFTR